MVHRSRYFVNNQQVAVKLIPPEFACHQNAAAASNANWSLNNFGIRTLRCFGGTFEASSGSRDVVGRLRPLPISSLTRDLAWRRPSTIRAMCDALQYPRRDSSIGHQALSLSADKDGAVK